MQKEFLDSVFHSYDVRGIVDEQLNSEFFYNLGKAFASFLNAKNIAVGYDIRPKSRVFSESFIKGANECGCNVEFLGEIATEMLYFHIGENTQLDGGVVITASHSPAKYNGCKFVGKNVKPFSKNWGLESIKNLMINEEYISSNAIGNTKELDIYPQFKKKILSFLDTSNLSKLNLVVDAGNGIGGKIFKYVFGDLGFKTTEMYFEPDGNFPNHVPDPLKEENVIDIKKRVVDENADLGIAIDGDADRVFFIDRNGRNPLGVYISSIFSKYFCSIEKNAKIIHDPRVTWPITKEIEILGGIPIENKAGHSFFKERMKEEDAIFGGELSSHFFYRDFYYADSGMVTVAIMLKLISEGLNLEDELDHFYKNYILSGEVNYIVKNPDLTLEKIKNHFSEYKNSEIDGVSIEFSDWRFNLRKSNTEPLLRLNLESTNLDSLKSNFKLMAELIEGERQNLPSIKSLIEFENN